jgi:hypothetical protein
MEDIKQLETEKAGLQQRFNIVERQVQDIEEKEKAKVKDKGEAYQYLDLLLSDSIHHFYFLIVVQSYLRIVLIHIMSAFHFLIGQQLKNKNDELSQKATDPNIDMEDIKQLETEKIFSLSLKD